MKVYGSMKSNICGIFAAALSCGSFGTYMFSIFSIRSYWRARRSARVVRKKRMMVVEKKKKTKEWWSLKISARAFKRALGNCNWYGPSKATGSVSGVGEVKRSCVIRIIRPVREIHSQSWYIGPIRRLSRSRFRGKFCLWSAKAQARLWPAWISSKGE